MTIDEMVTGDSHITGELPIAEGLTTEALTTEALTTDVEQRTTDVEQGEQGILPEFLFSKIEPELDKAEFIELNKKFIGEFEGFKVFTVSGEFIRNNLECDFTMGSHHYMSSFIPEGEVWLDEKMSENDRIALIHHEIHETKLMKKGMSYEQAHASATRSELRLRKKFNNRHKNLPLTLFCSFVPNPSKTL